MIGGGNFEIIDLDLRHGIGVYSGQRIGDLAGAFEIHVFSVFVAVSLCQIAPGQIVLQVIVGVRRRLQQFPFFVGGFQAVLSDKISYQIHSDGISDIGIQTPVVYQAAGNCCCGVDSVEMGICVGADHLKVEAIVDIMGFLNRALNLRQSDLCRIGGNRSPYFSHDNLMS